MTRIPLNSAVSTKDGETNKNSRMTNVLAASTPTGRSYVEVRPGLTEASAVTGDPSGNGIVEFDNVIFSVYGASLRTVVEPGRVGYGLLNINEYNTGGIPFASFPYGTNFTGNVVVGSALDIGPTTYHAFRWSADVGMEKIVTSTKSISAYYVTDDGLIVIGTELNTSNREIPFKWEEGVGKTTYAGFSASVNTTMTCANRDLTVFAGLTNNVPYVWVDGVGITTFTFSATSNVVKDVSDDGTVVVGSGVFSGLRKAARWQSGVVTELSGGGTSASANCCSIDGSVIFGSGPLPSNNSLPTPFKYEAGQYTELLPNYRGVVYACSDDGNHCCGTVLKDGVYIAFRWSRGVINFIDVFSDFGGQTTTTGSYPTKMSRDGVTVVGLAFINSPNPVAVTWTWYADTDVIYSEIVGDQGYPSAFAVSGDGFVTCGLYPYRGDGWGEATVFTPIEASSTRSLADLEDQFFDFAQSTL